MTLRSVILASAVALSAAACGSSPSSPSNPPTTTFTQTDIRVGTGADAVNGRTITAHYTVWLYDPAGPELKGRQIQTSVGGPPLNPFVLGASQVIRGWDIGVVGMKVGGLRRLIVPPDLAYGSNPPPNSTIPVNATLVFDIELLSAQ
jgi:FKBP-type peptidyl-prolyl cis-trans isomerase